MVGEMFAEDPELQAWDFMDNWGTGDGMSETDRKLIGKNSDVEAAVEEVLVILRERKSEFDKLVDMVMQFAEEENE